ncbi:hypothetical protein scyTo_0020590 [Scyliorhinus torazame]|uniref:Ricin B lectin domain-containing protein n=1 Tax=Scyliorhinus torazame TaxID=75743 RepID=A0A401PWY4_SCYTO|nr:hypothetical protein [Scyliorhinus torazame]
MCAESIPAAAGDPAKLGDVNINIGLGLDVIYLRANGLGEIRHLQTAKCISAQNHPSQKAGIVVVKECDLSDPDQIWVYDEEHELVLANLLCLDMAETRLSDSPRLMKCHGSGGSQQWTLGKNNRIYQVSAGQCLQVVDPADIKGYIAIAICDGSAAQQWQIES